MWLIICVVMILFILIMAISEGMEDSLYLYNSTNHLHLDKIHQQHEVQLILHASFYIFLLLDVTVILFSLIKLQQSKFLSDSRALKTNKGLMAFHLALLTLEAISGFLSIFTDRQWLDFSCTIVCFIVACFMAYIMAMENKPRRRHIQQFDQNTT